MCNPNPVENNENTNQGDLSNWLPITAKRKGKWWYSTFHNVTSMVGAGILGLPFAVSQLGWYPGIIAIVGSWMITFYTLYQLVNLHEVCPGKRFDRYFELGEHAFGPKLGYWIVMPQQMIVQVAINIVYCVTGGKSLKKFFDLMIPSMSNFRETYYTLIYIAFEVGLSQTPNFNSLKGVSLLAAVMSICYSMVACVASLVRGVHHHPHHYGVRSHTVAGRIFDALSALGTIAFSFAGHSVVLEIQATIPSTEEVPSKKPMWKGVVAAYIIVLLCYLTVAVSGFWAFGTAVEDDVLISLEHPAWLIAVANLMVFFHVIGSYQVFAMPIFDIIESNLVTRLHFTPGRLLRIIARSSYVLFAGLVSILIPFFGGLLGFFGGLVFSSTAYFLPCFIWVAVKKPKAWSFHWIASMICITIGVLIALLAPVGGIRQIIISVKSYRLFS